MTPSHSEHDPLARLADEFTARCRAGERPSPEDYAQRHPDLAEQIRDLFPALLVMERFGGSLGGKGVVPPSQVLSLASSASRRLGDYRILRQVGQGGMGVVYEAVQESLGRHVALKVLPPGLAGQGSFLDRFRREARAAARLHHTNIVPVFGVGECEGTHYYAMQFIPGQSLDRVLQDVRRLRSGADQPDTPADPSAGPSLAHSLQTGTYHAPEADGSAPTIQAPDSPARPDPSPGSQVIAGGRARYYHEVARLGSEVAQALAYAHKQGVLHRDVKPANLLLDAQGHVWLADFGLAKAEDSDDLTGTGDVVGTVRYVAPERFEGKADARSDVYALGATLYELLTLQPAFRAADRIQLIREVTHGCPPSPRSLAADVPRDLETIVLKAMAREPADRYAGAAELAEDLARFLTDRPVRARRHWAVARLWRWARRNPQVAGLVGMVATLLVALTVGAVLYSVRLAAALEREEAARREGEEKLLRAYVAEAKFCRFSGREGQRFEALKAIRQAAALARQLDEPEETFDELRSQAIAALTLPDVRTQTFPLPGQEDDFVVLDDNTLERCARLHPERGVVLFRLADQREIARLETKGIRSVLFLPDGVSMLCLHADGTINRWVIGHGSARRAAVTSCMPLARWEVSRDGRRLLLVTSDDVLMPFEVLDLEQGTLLYKGALQCDKPWVSCWSVSLSPDGKYLAVLKGVYGKEGGEVIRLIDLGTGKKVPARQVAEFVHPSGCSHPCWHPDGRTLAVGVMDTSEVYLWDAPSRERIGVLGDLRGGGLFLGMSRGGELLAAESAWSGGGLLWHPCSGKPLLRTAGHKELIYGAADGRLFYYQRVGSALHLTTAEPSPVLRTLAQNPVHGRPRDWRKASVHPKGRLLAVGASDGVCLFDLATGCCVGHLPLEGTHIPCFVPESGDLLTYSSSGLQRWPVTFSGPDSGRVRLGPPRKLPAPPCVGVGVASDRTGRVIAAATHKHALVLHGDGERIVSLGPFRDCRAVDVSPDGRWVVTACHWWGGDVDVWDATTGKHLHRFPGHDQSHRGWFSHDGRWLVSSNRAGLLRTGTWQEEARPGWSPTGLNPFSPDGKLLVGHTDAGKVSLHEAATGRRLAVLELPDEARPTFATFTPDGRRLLVSSNDSTATYVWDLPALRRELRALGLDWSPASEESEDRAAPRHLPPLQVEVTGKW